MNKYQLEDFNALLDGLTDLHSTFAPFLEDSTTGNELLGSIEGIVAKYRESFTDIDMEAPVTIPKPAAPVVEEVEVEVLLKSIPAGASTMKNVLPVLQAKTYSVNETLNADIFHIIEHHLKADLDTLDLDSLVMALNMARVIKNGKEAKLTLAERLEVAQLHSTFPLASTKKAAREYMSEMEKRLEETHGKYATKAKLTKTKFDTTATYSDEWVGKITDFADSLTTGMTLNDFGADAPAAAPQAQEQEQETTTFKLGKLSDEQIKLARHHAEINFDGVTLEQVIDDASLCNRLADVAAQAAKWADVKGDDEGNNDNTAVCLFFGGRANELNPKPKSALDRFMGK
jgi:hypothetical protein